jgi:hypothetical protein
MQLGLKFPKPGAEAAHQHVIDLSLHPEASLMAAQGHTFPLIIRLETITEDGAKGDHSLQVGMLNPVVLQGTSSSISPSWRLPPSLRRCVRGPALQASALIAWLPQVVSSTM